MIKKRYFFIWLLLFFYFNTLSTQTVDSLNLNISHDEFKRSTWISTKRIYANKYYQDASVWMFLGISHFWKEDGLDDDYYSLSVQGNIAFADANESEIYFIDNYQNRMSYAEAYRSEYQRGDTPYGYRMGISCPKYKCYEYFKSMEGKNLVWRFYNGNRKVADLEIPKSFRNDFLTYFDDYQVTFK